jgi:hypothetical protein
MFEQVTILRAQVNKLEEVLNGSFQMSLPTTYKKIDSSTQKTNNPADNTKQGSSGNDGEGNSKGRKKRKSDNGNSNFVRTTSQEDNFKVAAGKK